MSEKLKIGIIFGGKTAEAEVSLAGGRNVFNNIDQSKFVPVALYWDRNFDFWEIPEVLIIRNTTKEIEERLAKLGEKIAYEKLKDLIDLAFLITHGKYGDDGCLQGLLELLRIPYTGSGVLASALGMDKGVQRKIMAAYNNINIPKYQVIHINEWQKDESKIRKKIEKEFNFPLVIKPTREGSTFGVTVVKDQDQLLSAIKEANKYDQEILIEPYLLGREFSCIVVGNEDPQAFLPTETIHQDEIFTYNDKYLPGASNKITPMEIEQGIIEEIQRQCVATFKALNCRNYARIDGFVVDGKVYITDPNSAASTGMGPSSWTFHQAAKAGFNIKDFLTRLIELALENHQNKKGPL
ncbi:ATP-grasp domain-containing protein [Patescibacteria group bacterium]|nr:ATP-grasp domain-containing protein [Patescibacteria group bacterium]